MYQKKDSAFLTHSVFQIFTLTKSLSTKKSMLSFEINEVGQAHLVTELDSTSFCFPLNSSIAGIARHSI